MRPARIKVRARCACIRPRYNYNSLSSFKKANAFDGLPSIKVGNIDLVGKVEKRSVE